MFYCLGIQFWDCCRSLFHITFGVWLFILQSFVCCIGKSYLYYLDGLIKKKYFCGFGGQGSYYWHEYKYKYNCLFETIQIQNYGFWITGVRTHKQRREFKFRILFGFFHGLLNIELKQKQGLKKQLKILPEKNLNFSEQKTEMNRSTVAT